MYLPEVIDEASKLPQLDAIFRHARKVGWVVLDCEGARLGALGGKMSLLQVVEMGLSGTADTVLSDRPASLSSL